MCRGHRKTQTSSLKWQWENHIARRSIAVEAKKYCLVFNFNTKLYFLYLKREIVRLFHTAYGALDPLPFNIFFFKYNAILTSTARPKFKIQLNSTRSQSWAQRLKIYHDLYRMFSSWGNLQKSTNAIQLFNGVFDSSSKTPVPSHGTYILMTLFSALTSCINTDSTAVMFICYIFKAAVV